MMVVTRNGLIGHLMDEEDVRGIWCSSSLSQDLLFLLVSRELVGSLSDTPLNSNLSGVRKT